MITKTYTYYRVTMPTPQGPVHSDWMHTLAEAVVARRDAGWPLTAKLQKLTVKECFEDVEEVVAEGTELTRSP